MTTATLERTRSFWNASPCGAQTDLAARLRHRYQMESWIPPLLREIAARQQNVVEIGCGQGTDGLTLCSLLPSVGSYRGLDYSDESVATAHRAAGEAVGLLKLNVQPSFVRGNAEQLDLPSESVECIYSNGVLHHTSNPPQAFAEVHRVLKPAGEAYIALYRKPSLKVGISQGLRGIQRVFDSVLRTDRCLYKLVQGRHSPHLLGTMLLECFGVPVMEWYSRRELRTLFSKFSRLELESVGYNLPLIRPHGTGKTRFGYMWLLRLVK